VTKPEFFCQKLRVEVAGKVLVTTPTFSDKIAKVAISNPSLRGTKQSQTLQGDLLMHSANRGLLRTSQ